MTSGFQNVKFTIFLRGSGVLDLPEKVLWGRGGGGVRETNVENSLYVCCLKWKQRHEDALAGSQNKAGLYTLVGKTKAYFSVNVKKTTFCL